MVFMIHESWAMNEAPGARTPASLRPHHGVAVLLQRPPGFSNPWSDIVLGTDLRLALEDGPTVKLASPIGQLAMKLAAHRDRGTDVFPSSRDLEDMAVLIAKKSPRQMWSE